MDLSSCMHTAETKFPLASHEDHLVLDHQTTTTESPLDLGAQPASNHGANASER
jgi:hypothetical protein